MTSGPKMSIAEGISPEVLKRYLVRRGWRAATFADHRLVQLTLGDGDEAVEIIAPTSSADRQSTRSVFDALTTLSELENRNVYEIAMDMRGITADIVRSRVPDEYVRQQSIELRIAAEFIEGMKTFLATAATTELEPEKSHGRTKKQALEYAGQCRFGHTFKGSFGFVVESPVGLNDAPTIGDVEESVPFSRRVIQRVARGFDAVRKAEREDSLAPLVSGYETGFSANMCDDLVDIIEQTGLSRLQFGITFSPEWKMPTDIVEQPEFALQLKHLDILRDASKTLRVAEKPEPVTVVGKVRSLGTEGNPADLFQDKHSREIIISWDSEDHGLIRVKALVTPSDYLVAFEAHGKGQLIAIKGDLRRRGRTWLLESPKEISIIKI